jgi:hypothetical protein
MKTITIIFIVFLSGCVGCPDTKIYNYTKTWTGFDQLNLQGAKIRCPIVKPGNKCCTRFYKKRRGVYMAICGNPR